MSDEGVLHGETVDALLESVGGDKEFLADLVETFVADAPNLFAAMREGLQAADPEPVRRAAHTLKSTAASLGALALSETARALESQARDCNLELDIKAAEEQFEAVKSAFAALIGSEDSVG